MPRSPTHHHRARRRRHDPANHPCKPRGPTQAVNADDDAGRRQRRQTTTAKAGKHSDTTRAGGHNSRLTGKTGGWQAKQRVDCHLNRSVSPASFLSLLNFMLSYSWTWYLCNSVLCLCMTLCPIFAALCVLMRFLISLCIFLFVMPLCLYGDLYMLFMSLQ